MTDNNSIDWSLRQAPNNTSKDKEEGKANEFGDVTANGLIKNEIIVSQNQETSSIQSKNSSKHLLPPLVMGNLRQHSSLQTEHETTRSKKQSQKLGEGSVVKVEFSKGSIVPKTGSHQRVPSPCINSEIGSLVLSDPQVDGISNLSSISRTPAVTKVKESDVVMDQNFMTFQPQKVKATDEPQPNIFFITPGDKDKSLNDTRELIEQLQQRRAELAENHAEKKILSKRPQDVVPIKNDMTNQSTKGTPKLPKARPQTSKNNQQPPTPKKQRPNTGGEVMHPKLLGLQRIQHEPDTSGLGGKQTKRVLQREYRISKDSSSIDTRIVKRDSQIRNSVGIPKDQENERDLTIFNDYDKPMKEIDKSKNIDLTQKFKISALTKQISVDSSLEAESGRRSLNHVSKPPLSVVKKSSQSGTASFKFNGYYEANGQSSQRLPNVSAQAVEVVSYADTSGQTQNNFKQSNSSDARQNIEQNYQIKVEVLDKSQIQILSNNLNFENPDEQNQSQSFVLTPQQVPKKFNTEQKSSISYNNSVSVQKECEIKVANLKDLTDENVSNSRSYNHLKVGQDRVNLEVVEDVDLKSSNQLVQNNLAIERSAEGSQASVQQKAMQNFNKGSIVTQGDQKSQLHRAQINLQLSEQEKQDSQKSNMAFVKVDGVQEDQSLQISFLSQVIPARNDDLMILIDKSQSGQQSSLNKYALPIQDEPQKSFGNVTQSHVYDPTSKINLNSSIKRVKFDGSEFDQIKSSREQKNKSQSRIDMDYLKIDGSPEQSIGTLNYELTPQVKLLSKKSDTQSSHQDRVVDAKLEMLLLDLNSNLSSRKQSYKNQDITIERDQVSHLSSKKGHRVVPRDIRVERPASSNLSSQGKRKIVNSGLMKLVQLENSMSMKSSQKGVMYRRSQIQNETDNKSLQLSDSQKSNIFCKSRIQNESLQSKFGSSGMGQLNKEPRVNYSQLPVQVSLEQSNLNNNISMPGLLIDDSLVQSRVQSGRKDWKINQQKYSESNDLSIRQLINNQDVRFESEQVQSLNSYMQQRVENNLQPESNKSLSNSSQKQFIKNSQIRPESEMGSSDQSVKVFFKKRNIVLVASDADQKGADGILKRSVNDQDCSVIGQILNRDFQFEQGSSFNGFNNENNENSVFIVAQVPSLFDERLAEKDLESNSAASMNYQEAHFNHQSRASSQKSLNNTNLSNLINNEDLLKVLKNSNIDITKVQIHQPSDFQSECTQSDGFKTSNRDKSGLFNNSEGAQNLVISFQHSDLDEMALDYVLVLTQNVEKVNQVKNQGVKVMAIVPEKLEPRVNESQKSLLKTIQSGLSEIYSEALENLLNQNDQDKEVQVLETTKLSQKESDLNSEIIKEEQKEVEFAVALTYLDDIFKKIENGEHLQYQEKKLEIQAIKSQRSELQEKMQSFRIEYKSEFLESENKKSELSVQDIYEQNLENDAAQLGVKLATIKMDLNDIYEESLVNQNTKEYLQKVQGIKFLLASVYEESQIRDQMNKRIQQIYIDKLRDVILTKTQKETKYLYESAHQKLLMAQFLLLVKMRRKIREIYDCALIKIDIGRLMKQEIYNIMSRTQIMVKIQNLLGAWIQSFYKDKCLRIQALAKIRKAFQMRFLQVLLKQGVKRLYNQINNDLKQKAQDALEEEVKVMENPESKRTIVPETQEAMPSLKPEEKDIPPEIQQDQVSRNNKNDTLLQNTQLEGLQIQAQTVPNNQRLNQYISEKLNFDDLGNIPQEHPPKTSGGLPPLSSTPGPNKTTKLVEFKSFEMEILPTQNLDQQRLVNIQQDGQVNSILPPTILGGRKNSIKVEMKRPISSNNPMRRKVTSSVDRTKIVENPAEPFTNTISSSMYSNYKFKQNQKFVKIKGHNSRGFDTSIQRNSIYQESRQDQDYGGGDEEEIYIAWQGSSQEYKVVPRNKSGPIRQNLTAVNTGSASTKTNMNADIFRQIDQKFDLSTRRTKRLKVKMEKLDKFEQEQKNKFIIIKTKFHENQREGGGTYQNQISYRIQNYSTIQRKRNQAEVPVTPIVKISNAVNRDAIFFQPVQQQQQTLSHSNSTPAQQFKPYNSDKVYFKFMKRNTKKGQPTQGNMNQRRNQSSNPAVSNQNTLLLQQNKGPLAEGVYMKTQEKCTVLEHKRDIDREVMNLKQNKKIKELKRGFIMTRSNSPRTISLANTQYNSKFLMQQTFSHQLRSKIVRDIQVQKALNVEKTIYRSKSP